MHRCLRRAFTLVELLVVVTIIVLLLALLIPAIDRAIYQTLLVVCGANQHALVLGAQSYAAHNGRRYPARPALEASGERATCIRTMFGSGSVISADDRVPLRGYVSINGQLNCPLTQRVDLETNLADTSIFSPIVPWFGVRYRANSTVERGMYRVGDHFTYTEVGDGSTPPIEQRFNILTGDWDGVYTDANPSHYSTHPDRDGIMIQWIQQDDDSTQQYTGGTRTRTPGLMVTWSIWSSPTPDTSRGMLDNNYGFDDGSVVRFSDVPPYAGDPASPVEPEGWVWIPSYQSGANQATYKVQLPRPR